MIALFSVKGLHVRGFRSLRFFFVEVSCVRVSSIASNFSRLLFCVGLCLGVYLFFYVDV